MSHINRRAVLAAVPGALVLAVAGFPATSAAADQSDYVMRLSSTSATVAAGGSTRTIVSFQSEPYLLGTRVRLSVTGLPDGAAATFLPPTPLIAGRSVLTIRTAPSSPAGATALTVTAITLSSDPIGTSATFSLTIAGGVS